MRGPAGPISDTSWTRTSTPISPTGIRSAPVWPAVGITAPLNNKLLVTGPETSDAVEIGFKGDAFAHRLQFNADAFYQHFNGYIGRTVDSIYYSSTEDGVIGGSAPLNYNGDAESEGIEGDVGGLIIPGWDADVKFSYVYAHYDNAEQPCNVFNASGSAIVPIGQQVNTCPTDGRIAETPRFHLTVTSEYDYDTGTSYEPYLRGLFTYQPGFHSSVVDYNYDDLPLLNLYAGVRNEDQGWDLSVFAKNLIDIQRVTNITQADYQQATSVLTPAFALAAGRAFDSGYRPVNVSLPREIGVTLRYRFGGALSEPEAAPAAYTPPPAGPGRPGRPAQLSRVLRLQQVGPDIAGGADRRPGGEERRGDESDAADRDRPHRHGRIGRLQPASQAAAARNRSRPSWRRTAFHRRRSRSWPRASTICWSRPPTASASRRTAGFRSSIPAARCPDLPNVPAARASRNEHAAGEFGVDNERASRMASWRLATAILSFLVMGIAGSALAADDPLVTGFRDPPNSARPRVWWHWLDGNVTKDGITLDVEWMKRIGLGGAESFQAFLGPIGPGNVVDKRLAYMSADWQDAFHHAAVLADRLGLELGIAASPGWSETGGPWVSPAHAMKKFVWSETLVTGGAPFDGRLAEPPAVTGPYQSLPLSGFQSAAVDPLIRNGKFYVDSAVIAYPASDTPMAAEEHASLTASAGGIDGDAPMDGTLSHPQSLPMARPGQSAWIAFEYAQPVTIRAMTVMVGDISSLPGFGTAPPAIGLESSADGHTFSPILAPRVLRVPAFGTQPIPTTVAVPATKARYFRVVFVTPPPQPPMPAIFGPAAPPATAWSIPELVLHTDPRVDRVEDKAGFVPAIGLDGEPPPDDGIAIAKEKIVDLAGKLRADGTLDWTPPAGRWLVLRMGYSLLGITNHPAPTEATGLEVDKFQPWVCERVSGHVSLPVCASHPGPDGKTWRHRDYQRQLGGRIAELDRRHVGPVPETSRLRPAPLASGSDRAGGRERRRERPVPVGFPGNPG